MKTCFKPLPILLLFCGMASEVRAGHLIYIVAGQAKTFNAATISGSLTPANVKTTLIGKAAPRAGELMISLAPAGHAVGMVKFHVFERTPKPMNLQVLAFHGETPIATEDLCGRLDTDAWVALPAETSRAEIAKLVPADKECP